MNISIDRKLNNNIISKIMQKNLKLVGNLQLDTEITNINIIHHDLGIIYGNSEN